RGLGAEQGFELRALGVEPGDLAASRVELARVRAQRFTLSSLRRGAEDALSGRGNGRVDPVRVTRGVRDDAVHGQAQRRGEGRAADEQRACALRFDEAHAPAVGGASEPSRGDSLGLSVERVRGG
ncbi:MAG: hypothetical protein ACK56I_22365, partial [bacterium]